MTTTSVDDRCMESYMTSVQHIVILLSTASDDYKILCCIPTNSTRCPVNGVMLAQRSGRMIPASALTARKYSSINTETRGSFLI